jgi:large subunit ribosomal protein L17
MRHLKAGRKLGRTTSHRLALLRNMATSLLEHETIETTEAKAKELKPLTDKLITLGKRGDLHARRLAMRVIRDKSVGKKLFDEIAPRFNDRSGGYTRIMKVRRRHGDNAPMSIIELVVKGKQKLEEKQKLGAKQKAAKKQKAEEKQKGEGKKTEKRPAQDKPKQKKKP